LRPLAEHGVIELVDYTHFFDSPDGEDCSAFWDLYHQNAESQKKLTDSLLPRIEKHFYKSYPQKL
jgi:enterochelin esterase-like enzyme